MLTASKEAIERLIDDVEYLWTAPISNISDEGDPYIDNNSGTSNSNIDVYDHPPSALHFLRHHVAASRPCLIRNAMPADLRTLSLAELLSQWPDDLPTIQVDVTPDGHGDCLRRVTRTASSSLAPREAAADSPTHPVHENNDAEFLFAKPMECEMSISEFCEALKLHKGARGDTDPLSVVKTRIFPRDDTAIRTDSDDGDDIDSGVDKGKDECNGIPTLPPPHEAVFYYSRQNDCFRTELKPLWDKLQLPRTLDWAAQAFDAPEPDAVNLWIGGPQAVSAMHKDHYENLFHVWCGTKVFTLVPPAYAPLLGERLVPSGRFVWNEQEKQWKVKSDVTADGTVETVQWVTVDVTRQPSSSTTSSSTELPVPPFRQVRVQAGEMLYLPALWYHGVSQCGDITMGVNYWYDMKFESPLWAYFHFLQQMQPTEDAPVKQN